jgi:hypothetical protein
MTDVPAKAAAEREVAAFRSRSRQFAIAAAVVLAAILAVCALNLLVILLRGHVMRPQTLQKLALAWAPAPFYLWALWTLRGMFAALARTGISFQPVVSKALERVGLALVLGAGISVLASPLMLALIRPRTIGGFAIVNVPSLTIGVVGLALIATAFMLRRAARLEAEAARLKATLEDFI